MNAVNDLDEEKPLDPAVERVRRRMLRLMVISIGIMMTGLMAVLGAIVYKIGSYGEEAEAVAPAPVGTTASMRGSTAPMRLVYMPPIDWPMAMTGWGSIL